MDNASSNDTMCRGIVQLLKKKYNMDLEVDDSRARCVAHVGNLSAQDVLHVLGEADDPQVLDYFESHKKYPIHFDEAAEVEVMMNTR